MTRVLDERVSSTPPDPSVGVRGPSRPPVTTVGGRPVLRESLVVLGLLLVLEIVVFRSYLSGEHIPPWDFTSHYNTDAFAWWADGGFFRPAGWMPYLWGGYPAVLDVQNSSWYLPVGVMSLVVPFDLHASAVLSAAHVGAGALGMYVLARRFGLPFQVCLVGLVAWFFVGPFYANAQHLDIMRAYAWCPWILVCLSARWPWRRWWAAPVAGLILWQALLGMYPGIVVAGLYLLPVWVIGNQIAFQPAVRRYLLPVVLTAVAALAMASLRYLPYVLIRGTSSPRGGDQSQFSWSLLATTVYPYDLSAMPNDISMRSFFVGAPVIAALALVVVRDRLTWVALPVAISAVGLGLPGWPWAPLVDRLPGLDISRFRMSDFKVYLLAMLVLLALVAISSLLQRSHAPVQPPGDPDGSAAPWRWGVMSGLVVVALGAAVVGGTLGYPAAVWLPQWVLLVVSALLLTALCRPSSDRGRASARVLATVGVPGLAVTAALSGYLSVTATTVPWQSDRVTQESAYGAPIRELITARPDPDQALPQRPGRLTPGPGPGPFDLGALLAVGQNRVHYAGGASVAGYVNLTGAGSYDMVLADLMDPAASPGALAFWSAPGTGVRTTDGALPELPVLTRCLDDGDCGDAVAVRPVSYQPSGRLTYQVTAMDRVEVSFNEAYYPGWSAVACPVGSAMACRVVPVSGGAAGQLVADLPAGAWDLDLAYQTPGQAAAWVLFAAGVAVLITLGLVAALGRQSRGSALRTPDGGAG